MSRCSTTEHIDTQRKRMPRARVARRACVGRNTNSLRRKKAGACMRAKACGANSQGRTGFSCNWGAGPWLEPRPAYQQPRREEQEGLTSVSGETQRTPHSLGRKKAGAGMRAKACGARQPGAHGFSCTGCGAVARARRALQLSSPMQGSLYTDRMRKDKERMSNSVGRAREAKKKRG